MRALRYSWTAGDRGHALDLVYVEGTNGQPYAFGEGTDSRPMEVQGFFIGTVPVNQASGRFHVVPAQPTVDTVRQKTNAFL
jgi:hypothetical protein